MLKRKIIYLLLGIVLLLYSEHIARAQQVNNIVQALNGLKDLSEFGYSYQIKMNFPDGQTDSVSGETYTSPSKGIVYNHSGLSTIFYNGKLFYNANHVRKNVTVYKMNKRFDQKTADSIQAGTFQLFLYKEWMDSVIMKYGQISGAVVVKDVISFDINFPANVTIRKISVKYDMARKIPVRIEVKAMASEDDEGMITSTIVCTNYSRTFDEKKLDSKNYFDITGNDQIVLNKYKNYKLFTIK